MDRNITPQNRPGDLALVDVKSSELIFGPLKTGFTLFRMDQVYIQCSVIYSSIAKLLKHLSTLL